MLKFPAPIALVLAVGLLFLQACGQASQGADCDRLLGRQQYQQVLRLCGNPFHRASALLGLAGFSMLDMIESSETSDGGQSAADGIDIPALLGLTVENITERRLLISEAAETVRDPQSGNQAFALLISAYLGLEVTMSEYLDNGAGTAVALDDQFDDIEVESATGLVSTSGAALQFLEGIPAYFQILNGSAPLNVLCVNDNSVPFCDGSPGGSTEVFEDPDGSGRLDTDNLPESLADQGLSQPTMSGVAPVNLVVEMTDLELPISVDQSKQARMENFLGQGDPEAEFKIGVTGYLDLLDRAAEVLAFFSGSTGGGGTVISDAIGSARAQLDNGGECMATRDPEGTNFINMLFAIYQTAPGTVATPDEGLTDFTGRNLATNAELEEGGVTLPATVAASDFIFTAPIGFKFLYPLSLPANAFDVANTTPRVDETPTSFRTEFENIPRLAPDASTADDGQITFLELSCSGA